ncbi:MAG: alpha/beta hydrolase-fold protein [Planctomycetota bacterium]
MATDLVRLLLGSTLMAASDPPRVSIPGSEVHTIQSKSVGAELRVWIAAPVAPSRPRPPEKPRLVCVLDADLFFGTVVDTTRLMYQLYQELPPLVVVGVAYPTEDRSVQAELRTRDFTPSHDAQFEEQGKALAGGREPTLQSGQRTGGADAFARFLRDEMLPLVRAHHDLARGDSTLIGSSLGGLFAAWMLLSEPGVFDHYVIISPALWWGKRELFDLEAATADERAAARTRVFLAVGAGEEDARIPSLAPFRMVSSTREMAERLRARKDAALELDCRVFDGETHTTVVPVAITHGLRWAYRAR